MTPSRKLTHSLIALGIGLAGLAFVLFAWQLPPFDSSQVTTRNAYVRGQVTAIAPQLSGMVTEVPVQDFQQVATGDVLARIDARRYEQAVARASAALDAARADLDANAQSIHSAQANVKARQAALASARAALATAQSTWNRYVELKERGVVSQSAYDQADLSLQQARAAVDQAASAVEVAGEELKTARVRTGSLKAAVASAEAALELARIDLGNTVIHAPADGRLGQVSVRRGQYVSPGTTLMSEVTQDTWVIANFKETQLPGMRSGQEVTFTVDAMRDHAFHGHLERFSPATGSEFSVLSASNATGNFTKVAQRLPVRIRIDPGQPGAEGLVPGLSVVVHLDRQADPA